MKKTLAIIVLFLAPVAAAVAQDAEYIVRPENSTCYLDDAVQSSAEACGQCLRDAGEEMKRTFRVFCKDASRGFTRTKKVVTVGLTCDPAEGSKGERWWLNEAKDEMEDDLSLISSDTCDLGGWPLLSKENAIGAGVLLAAGALALFAASGEAEYKISKKPGKSGECRSGNKRLRTGAEYCHNCVGSGGDRVARKYEVFCGGQSVGQVTAVLTCRKKYRGGNHGEEDKELEKLAKEELRRKAASWSNECRAP